MFVGGARAKAKEQLKQRLIFLGRAHQIIAAEFWVGSTVDISLVGHMFLGSGSEELRVHLPAAFTSAAAQNSATGDVRH